MQSSCCLFSTYSGLSGRSSDFLVRSFPFFLKSSVHGHIHLPNSDDLTPSGLYLVGIDGVSCTHLAGYRLLIPCVLVYAG